MNGTCFFVVEEPEAGGVGQLNAVYDKASDAQQDVEARQIGAPGQDRWRIVKIYSDISLNISEASGVLQEQINTIKDSPNPAPPGSWSFAKSFNSSNKPYITHNGGTYTKVATFRFPGTTVSIPTTFKIIGYNTRHNATVGAVRIYDATNGNEVCRALIRNSTDSMMVDSNSISNLPPLEAVFEVQVKEKGKYNRFRLEYVELS